MRKTKVFDAAVGACARTLLATAASAKHCQQGKAHLRRAAGIKG
jgi:hypothetical protein